MQANLFQDIRENLEALQELEHCLPITEQTSPGDKQRIKHILRQLVEIVQNLATRMGRMRHREQAGARGKEEELRRLDWLDSEGVRIWNLAVSGTTKVAAQGGAMEDPQCSALLRLAAFKLIQVASDSKSKSEEDTCRLLHVLSRTISSLIEAKENHYLNELLVAGVEYEKAIMSFPLPETQLRGQQQVDDLLGFSMARIDSARAQGKLDSAFNFMQSTLENLAETRFGLKQYERVLSKCWTIGEELRMESTDGKSELLAEAITWLQLGVQVFEKAESHLGSKVMDADLKQALFRSLLRAFIADSQFEEASNVLQELIQSLKSEDSQSHQEISILRLHLEKQAGRSEAEMRPLIQKIIETTAWTEEGVEAVIGELHSFKDLSDLSVWGMHFFLQKALATASAHQWVQKILMSLFLSLRSSLESRPQAAFLAAHMALDAIASHPGYKLEDTACSVACETIIWSLAEKCLTDGTRYEHAGNWFKLGAHNVFQPAGPTLRTACFRKAALCYINAGDFIQADDMIRACPINEAATQYLLFLASVKQGQQQKAITALQSILQCPDLDGKQLLLMASLAHDKAYDKVLYCSMEALLKAIKDGQMDPSLHVEMIAVVRCLIRLTLVELESVVPDQASALLNSVRQHFELALDILVANDNAKALAAEILWLCKTAFNTAVTQADSGDPIFVTDLFDISATLMTLYEKAVPLESADSELLANKAAARFACLCGKLFFCREMPGEDDKALLLQQLAGYLPQCRHDCQAALQDSAKADQEHHLKYMIEIIDVFEVEIWATSKEWKAAEDSIREMATRTNQATQLELDYKTSFEAAVDVLFSFTNCPSEVVLEVVEILLGANSLCTPQNISRFASWIRAVLMTLLGGVSGESETKAIHYLQKAMRVLEDQDLARVYPAEEVKWLVAQSWNTGLEKVNTCGLNRGRVFCELALALATYSPDGPATLPAMRNYYNTLIDNAAIR